MPDMKRAWKKENFMEN